MHRFGATQGAYAHIPFLFEYNISGDVKTLEMNLRTTSETQERYALNIALTWDINRTKRNWLALLISREMGLPTGSYVRINLSAEELRVFIVRGQGAGGKEPVGGRYFHGSTLETGRAPI